MPRIKKLTQYHVISGTLDSGKSTIAFERAIKDADGDLSRIGYITLGNAGAVPAEMPQNNLYSLESIDELDDIELIDMFNDFDIIIIDDAHRIINLVMNARVDDLDSDANQRDWSAVGRGLTRLMLLASNAKSVYITTLVRPDDSKGGMRHHLNSNANNDLATKSTTFWYTYFIREGERGVQKDKSKAFRLVRDQDEALTKSANV